MFFKKRTTPASIANEDERNRRFVPMGRSACSALPAYRLSASFLMRDLYDFSSCFSRYLRCFLRSATIWSSPRREWKSLRFFLRCFESSSICFVSIATCASGEPVSVSCRRTSFMTFSFFRFVSIVFKNASQCVDCTRTLIWLTCEGWYYFTTHWHILQPLL